MCKVTTTDIEEKYTGNVIAMHEKILKDLAEYIDIGNMAAADAVIRQHEKELNHHHVFLKLKALFHMRKRAYDLAIECLKAARNIEPNDHEIYYHLTYAYERKEKNEVVTYDVPQQIMQRCPPASLTQRRAWLGSQLLPETAPLVSIYIVAYNHLEDATKTCIECVLKYTVDIDYELILVDNGSADGTLAYFEQVPYQKKKVIRVEKNKGLMYGSQIGMKEIRGKYIVSLPNDVWVTKNWLKNMLICLESDDAIGMVVPMSDNTFNFQDPEIAYTDFTDMQRQAEKFNVSNPAKWQERLRLITVAALCRRECVDTMGFFDYGFLHNFADDDLSFRYRQYGYKLMLCGDVFVHHMGSVVTVSEAEYNLNIAHGAKDFERKFFGLRAWQDTFLAGENEMLNLIACQDCDEKNGVAILGMEVRCGSIMLKLKNKLKQHCSSNVKLAAFSTRPQHWVDLHSICDREIHVGRPESFSGQLYSDKFDFILIGEPLNQYSSMLHLLEQALLLLKPGGKLYFRINPTGNVKVLLHTQKEEREPILLNISLKSLFHFIDQCGRFTYKAISVQNDGMDEIVENALDLMHLGNCKKRVLQNMQVEFYLLTVEKVRETGK